MIFVECKPDRALVESITKIPGRKILHAGGISRVCKSLEKHNNSKGLVDEDPDGSKPSCMQKLELEEDFSEYNLKALRDKRNNNRLVVLCPGLEEWILRAAKEANLNVQDYGLPDNAKKLHEIINVNLGKFIELLEEMKLMNLETLKILKKLLEE